MSTDPNQTSARIDLIGGGSGPEPAKLDPLAKAKNMLSIT
jgi:hypothetical protein